MPVDTTQLRTIAARVKRQTTNPEIIDLCDAVLVRPEGCPVCAARRAAKAATQRKWRNKDKTNG